MYGTFRPANFTPTLVEPPEFSPQSLKAFPEELDLRNEGFVTDVKNQFVFDSKNETLAISDSLIASP